MTRVGVGRGCAGRK